MRPVWADLHVNVHHRFADMAGGVEAGIAQLQAELVFAFCVEAAMAFETGGVRRLLELLAYMNFGTNLGGNHGSSPEQGEGKWRARRLCVGDTEDRGLIGSHSFFRE